MSKKIPAFVVGIVVETNSLSLPKGMTETG